MVGDFVCNVCGKQFIAKRALYLHMRGVHTEVEVPCNDCDKIFKSKTKLEYHTRATHQEKNSFYCDVKVGDTRCTYYSATKSNLRAHKKRVHEKTLPNPPELVCGSCDYRTNRKFNLDTHSEKCKISDRSPINHSCNLCNKTFSTKKHLTRHKKLHDRTNNAKPISDVSCVVCKKTFVNTWNLNRHTKKDHGLTEIGNVVKNSVGMAVFTTEALVKEKVSKPTHEKQPLQCDQCDYKSLKRNNLTRHMTKHDGIKKPETRERKKKNGLLSDRTKRRRKVENGNYQTEREVSWLGKSLRVSERDLRKVVSFTTRKSGISFKGNLDKYLKNKKRILGGHFTTKLTEFHDKKGNKIERNLTCTIDLDTLIQKVINVRKVAEPLILVGCDGGLGSFLVTLVVIDKSRNYKLEKIKPTGFPRILIPAKVRDIPESTHNLRVIFDAIKINELSKKYKMIGDLKVYNLLMGMQSSGSTHPCPYGLCYKVDQMGRKTNQKGSWVKGDDRTLEGNAEEATAYAETSQNRATLKYFFNCEFQPVLRAQNPTKVKDLLTIPVLHTVLLGPFNSLWNTLSDHFPIEAETYALVFGMKGAGKGGDFNGNTVKAIIHDEMNLAHLEGILPDHAKIFVDCLRGIAEVHTVVTSPILNPEFESIISNFIMKWKTLEELFGIGCTQKIHIIGTHLVDVLRDTGKTLHDESDEPVELAHFRVNAFEHRHGYHISDRKMMTPTAAERQQNMMVHLNSYHLE